MIIFVIEIYAYYTQLHRYTFLVLIIDMHCGTFEFNK